jgi:virulence factor Mce-like protein
MNRSRASSSVVSNPVLVGAVTVLVTLVAVFLAYNANNGLPFVPTTTLKVQLTSGANLVKGNEVRSGGYRVGVIQAMEPVELRDGSTGALLTLKLDRKLGDIPSDTAAVVRARSALGLKYLDLQTGKSPKNLSDGDLLPADQTEVPVDLDRVFEMFDEKTREGARQNLRGFGDSFAGRGQSLGRTIEELPDLFTHLEPVMANLSDEDTDLKGFFTELGDAARIVAPVSKTQARLFTDMADTFEAFGRDETALKDFISKGPPTLDVSTDSLQAQRPFLTAFADFSEDFQGATRELRAALPTVNSAISSGIGPQLRSVAMDKQLGEAMTSLRKLAEPPATAAGLRALTATIDTLNPQLRFYGPFVTVCNYWNYFWTYIAEHFSEEDITGHSQRALINGTGRQDDSLSAMGANAPANGQGVQEGTPQFFHGFPYGAAIGPDGRADCESGQRGFLERQAKNLPKEFKIHADPRNPGLQGSTFTGRARVPEGQTYTAIPETGPYKDIPASEGGDR